MATTSCALSAERRVGMAKCDRCKKYSEKYDCAECKPDYKTTKADKIRAMSDEELADYLYRMALCSLTTVEIDNKEIAIPKLLKWLQSEAK